MSRGREILANLVEMDRDDQDGPAEEDDDDNGGDDGGQDVVFTQQSFANKITKLGFAANRKKILARMGKMFSEGVRQESEEMSEE